ncbi:glycosyltransferase family 4 protein [Microcoleus vaginatus]|uniref:glycosyltransferase family 4 protein n=1 Tax=Microcoleus vaginatus TaxID=119532 RepID=UPI0032A6EEC3
MQTLHTKQISKDLISETTHEPKQIRVLIIDGGRHRIYSGYGHVAQSFAIALARNPRLQVQILDNNKQWEYEGIYEEELKSIECATNLDNCDLILQIGPPQSFKKYQKPCMFFTLCDQSDLDEQDIKAMKEVDAILTASSSGLSVFSKYFSKVYVTPLPVDSQIFKPVPRWRSEGSDCFSFIFVGSFSFRKGVDLLVEAFFQEFSWEEVNLHLHCPGDKADEIGNFLIKKSQEHKKPPMCSFSTKSLHPAWVNRFYNRADAFVSFTRGEGWGLPIAEAMLCGLPVIAPLSTSMLDYLTSDVAFCLPTQEKLVSEISDPFGQNFKASHSGSYYEIDLPEAKKCLRYVWSNKDQATEIGKKGRAHMNENFSFERFSNCLHEAIVDFTNSIATYV